MKKLITLALVLVLTLSMATTAFAAYDSGAITKTVTATTDNGTQEDGQAYTNSWTIDIPAGTTADAVNPEDIAANYYVVVTWEVQSTLTYAADETCYTWNVYDSEGNAATADGNAASAGYETIGAVWKGTATVDISVTNWSNRAMTAEIALAGAVADESKGIEAAIVFSEDCLNDAAATLDLANAAANATLDGETMGTADTKTHTFTIDCSAEDLAEKDIDKTSAINMNDAVIGQVTITLAETVATTTPADPQG